MSEHMSGSGIEDIIEDTSESESEDMSERAQELACQVMNLGHVRDLIFAHRADSLWYDVRKEYLIRRYLTLNKDYASSIIKALWAKADHGKFMEMAVMCDPDRIALYRSSVLSLTLPDDLDNLLDVLKLNTSYPRLRRVHVSFKGCRITVDLAQANVKSGLHIQFCYHYPLPLDDPGLWLWPQETARFKLLSLTDDGDRLNQLREAFLQNARFSSQIDDDRDEAYREEAYEPWKEEPYVSSYSIILDSETVDEREFFTAVLGDLRQLDWCNTSMPFEQFRLVADVAPELESLSVVIARRDFDTTIEDNVLEYNSAFQKLARCQRLKRLAIFAQDYGQLGLPLLRSFPSLEHFEWHGDVNEIWRQHYGDSGGPSRFSQFPQPPSGTLKKVIFFIPGEEAMNPISFLHLLLETFPVDADISFRVADSLDEATGNRWLTRRQEHQGACEAVAFADWVEESHQAIVRELRASRSLQDH